MRKRREKKSWKANFYIHDQLLVKAEQDVVPPSQRAGEVYQMDETRAHHDAGRRPAFESPLYGFPRPDQRLFDDIAQSTVEEIDDYDAGPLCLGVMADEKPDVRAPDVSLGAREVDVVKRVHLVASGLALAVGCGLDPAARDGSEGYQAPIVP